MGLSLAKLRKTASAARRQYDKLKLRSLTLVQEDADSARPQGERATFIPASNGRDIIAPKLLSAAALTHLYTGARVLGNKKSGVVISGLGSQFKKNRSHRFLCPEIEVAKGDQKSLLPLLENWLGRTVHDGSLTQGGFEINVMPTQGDLFLKMVEEICENVKKFGGSVDKSCGLHVHVDARDFDYLDIRKLIFLYELVEPALFSCLPIERHNNRFCLPCGFNLANHIRKGEKIAIKDVAAEGKTKYDVKKPINTLVYGRDGRVQVGSKYGPGGAREVRYYGMNLYSWFFRNSVEFRHAPGSVDPRYIINWGLLCCGILDTAMKLGEQSIRSLDSGFLDSLIKDGKDIYSATFRSGTLGANAEVIKASTEVLKECVQEQCWDFIDELQAKWKKKEENPRKKESGMDTIDWVAVTASSTITPDEDDDL